MMSMERNSEDGALLSQVPEAIETFTGQFVNLLNPEAATIREEDIIHGLSMVCRYGGHVKNFYSVAEHSVLVHDLVLRVPLQDIAIDQGLSRGTVAFNLRLAALLHDAPEAFIGDMVAPLKYTMRKAQFGARHDKEGNIASVYDEIEKRFEEVIGKVYGLQSWWANRPEVRIADLWAMRIEATKLTHSGAEHWRWPHELPNDGAIPSDIYWQGGLNPLQAKMYYRNALSRLFQDRDILIKQ